MKLRRNKEYAVTLTGEQLALVWILSGVSNGKTITLYSKLTEEYFKDEEKYLTHIKLPTYKLHEHKKVVDDFFDCIFTPREEMTLEEVCDALNKDIVIVDKKEDK